MKSIELAVVRSLDCDVLVCGGGCAGIGAAIAAARSGSRVILAEADGYLGGAATAGLIGTFMTCLDVAGERQIIKGIYDEFITEMQRDGGAIDWRECMGGNSYCGYRTRGHVGVVPYNIESFKRTAERMCVEAGVKLLYHARLVAADVADPDGAADSTPVASSTARRIACAYFSTKAGIYEISAAEFIDATGDAALAHEAGATTFCGDENGDVQTSSMFFSIAGVDRAVLDSYMDTHTEMRERFFMDEIERGQRSGEFPCGTQKLRIFENTDGRWYVNMAQVDERIDTLDPEVVTAAEISQREQIPKIVEFLRRHIPGLENCYLVETAPALGIRETRRIEGEYILRGEDIMSGRRFDDGVVLCSNSVDMHKSVGVHYQPVTGQANYHIPLRSLIARDFDNLGMAGRCLSADRVALGAVRVMPPCFAMGEAIGITADMARRASAPLSSVPADRVRKAIVSRGGCVE